MSGLEDGWYLSTYLSPPGLAHVLQAWVRHDHGVAAWELTGGELRLQHYWEFERLSGMKGHGVAFRSLQDADAFLDRLLLDAGLDRARIRGVWGQPGLETTTPYAEWQELPLPMHSLAHLAGAVFADTDYLNAGGSLLGLAIDDTPDVVLDDREHSHWYAGALVRDGELTVFPVESPAALYSTAVHWFGLREGTLMALATACPAELKRTIPQAVAEYDYYRGDSRRDAAVLDALQAAAAEGIRHTDDRFTAEENLISAVMKQVQELGLSVLRRSINAALTAHEVDPTTTRLALAGGYALNCPTNRRLLDEYDFADLQAPPVVSDSGQAYGLGLLGFMRRQGPWPSFRFPGAYLGRRHDVAPAINRWRRFVAEDSSWDNDQVVRDLRHGVIGWFQDRAEIGPRALGNRSLLGDPTQMGTKTTLNTVKRRQWWRPVSPVALAEKADDWFDCRGPSPYMLQTMSVRPGREAAIPAVAHLDLSARVQSVTAAENPELHALLRAFDDAVGVPLLANTSMNDKEEPIVDTPDEAIAFCLSRGVEVLYLNDRRVLLRGGADGTPTGPLPRMFEPFAQADPALREEILARSNPHGLSTLMLMGWLYSSELAGLDLTVAEDAQTVAARLTEKFAARPDFEAACRRRLLKERHLTWDGVPIYQGGWLHNGR